MVNTNIEVVRGDTKSWKLSFTNGTSPIDIVGWVIYLTVRESPYDRDETIKISKVITEHIAPTSNGQSSINLSSTDTDISPKKYLYDIRVKTTDNSIYTVLQGAFNVIPNVTRRLT